MPRPNALGNVSPDRYVRVIATGMRPGSIRSVLRSVKMPVARSTGSAPGTSLPPCDVGPGCCPVPVSCGFHSAAPQQNFGIPTPASVVIVRPSALTVPVPAIRQSLGASPFRGDSSKYQS